MEQEKSFSCSGWKAGCRFAIWKKIAGKTIGVRTARSLLELGRTAVLKGFESKAGKKFEAQLTSSRAWSASISEPDAAAHALTPLPRS